MRYRNGWEHRCEMLDAFTREYGVKVNDPTCESVEEAVANLRAGRVYDGVVIE